MLNKGAVAVILQAIRHSCHIGPVQVVLSRTGFLSSPNIVAQVYSPKTNSDDEGPYIVLYPGLRSPGILPQNRCEDVPFSFSFIAGLD